VGAGTTACWIYGPNDARHTIIFLHGFRGTHHGLAPILAHLNGIRAVVPDLPGFGDSPPLRDSRHDIVGYAAWAGEFLRGFGGEPVLAGHSFGSIVAAAAARTARIAALMLVNPIATSALRGPRQSLTRLTVGFHRLAASLPERPGTALLRHPLATRIASSAMSTTSDPLLRSWIHAEHRRHFSRFANRRVLLEAFHASISSDVSQFASEIGVPTLLVAAESDDIAPLPTQQAVMERLREARLIVVPDVGHLVHYEAPAAAATAITEFIRGL
jgi:pimeloyl-ACP methyl ester carboxylesterase